MNIFEISKKILLKIINDDIPFAVALKTVFKDSNYDSNIKSNVTALVGCELRHHIIFNNICERFFKYMSLEHTVYARFYAANKLFLKRFLDKDIVELALNDIDKELFETFKLFIDTQKDIIPTDLDTFSPEYLSYRFNTPLWVINMWQKQFGRKNIVFKILKSNYHQSVPTLRLNTNEISCDDFLNKHPDFIASSVNDIIMYQGKGTPKSLPEFKQNKIFFMKMATKYVLDKLDIQPFKKMVVYSDVPNNIYLDFNARLKNDLNLDLIINHTQSYFETKNIIEQNHIKGIDLYNTSYNNIITCVSSQTDLLVCLPASTSFDLLRSTPDYFLRIKQDKLDHIILEEKNCLFECSKLIAVNGVLVYMVPTINKKETINIVGDFLSTNTDFELIEEKQFLPFESFDSCLYYAILRKKGDLSD